MTTDQTAAARQDTRTDAASTWSGTSIAIHWVAAGLVAALVAAGFVMSDLDAHSPLRLWLSRLHTVGGVSLVALTAFRLWRRRRGDRPAPLELPPLHRRGIALIHGLIYAVFFGLGISGLGTARSSSHWHEYLVGDVGYAPDMANVAPRAGHETLVVALLVLVSLHVGGVLVNEWRRGGTLARMLPFRR